MARLLSWRRLFSLFFELALLCALIGAFFIRTPQVSGLSMAPQIASGEYVLIDTLTYRFRAPSRGDVVAFRFALPGLEPSTYIKRVIGLPGDLVSIDRGDVFVDGRRLDEPYVMFRDDRTVRPVRVPAHSLYVLGDNRADSEDSRTFGCISQSAVVGTALAGVWPIRSVRAL